MTWICVASDVTVTSVVGALTSTEAEESVTGSRPVYRTVAPSTISVPELWLTGIERTDPRIPPMTSVSSPPAPPSTMPASPPPGSTTNVSSFPAAPVRFSKPLNATPAALPLPWPSTVHTVSVAGPTSVSVPEPPSNAIGMPAAASDASISKVSLPFPPRTVRPVTPESGRLVAVPSIVRSRFDPSSDAATV